MAISIRNRETEALIRELAARERLGVTEAVTLAVSAHLRRLDESSSADRREQLGHVAEWAWARVDPALVLDEADLYDDSGLPR